MPRSVIDIEKLNNKSAAGVLGFPMKQVGKMKKTGTGRKVRKVMNVSGVKLAKAGIKKGKKVAKKMKKKM